MKDYLEQLFLSPRALEKAVDALEDGVFPALPAVQAGHIPGEDAEGRAFKSGMTADGGGLYADFSGESRQAGETVGALFLAEEGSALPLQRAAAEADSAALSSLGRGGAAERALSGAPAAQVMPPAGRDVAVRTVDLAFQRDGRRYDNGFSLY